MNERVAKLKERLSIQKYKICVERVRLSTESLKETEELRTNLFNKQRELQNELDKDAPDASTASGLQKKISVLQAQLDQKRIENMVEMRKIAPNAGRGFSGGGPMMGYGPKGDYGPMMGYGTRGGANCW